MKKFLLFLVATVFATAARAADGDTFTYQGLKFRVISEADHSVAVDLNYNVSGDISIPSYAVNGSSRYFVTEIVSYAFHTGKMTSVTIPNSITTIGEQAFSSCHSLTTVSIPNSVTKIGVGAFEACRKMTEILVENGNPSYTAENGVLFNLDKKKLIQCPAGKTGSYTIPNSVTAIGAKALYFCSNLTSIAIPSSVAEIGEQSFYGCLKLTTVSIPASVVKIGKSAFGGCNRMTEILVENGNPNYTAESGVLFNIDKTKLIRCPAGKTGSYTIPNSVAEIESYAFDDCSSLTSITIPNLVTAIGSYVFADCSSLTSITIPNSVSAIGSSAFSGCKGLTSVTIPNSVNAIGSSAFSGCKGLISIAIPNSVAKIGSHAFFGCSSLTSATIPNSMAEIEASVFYGCSSLATVTIPASVSKIGMGAFKDCESLKTIYDLNPTPQTIGRDAFSGVPEDAVVYIPTGTFNKYFVAEGWTYFTDFREMGAGVDDVLIDPAASVDVFNLHGVAVLRSASVAELESLPAGIYIVRQGKEVKKIAVK